MIFSFNRKKAKYVFFFLSSIFLSGCAENVSHYSPMESELQSPAVSYNAGEQVPPAPVPLPPPNQPLVIPAPVYTPPSWYSQYQESKREDHELVKKCISMEQKRSADGSNWVYRNGSYHRTLSKIDKKEISDCWSNLGKKIDKQSRKYLNGNAPWSLIVLLNEESSLANRCAAESFPLCLQGNTLQKIKRREKRIESIAKRSYKR